MCTKLNKLKPMPKLMSSFVATLIFVAIEEVNNGYIIFVLASFWFKHSPFLSPQELFISKHQSL